MTVNVALLAVIGLALLALRREPELPAAPERLTGLDTAGVQSLRLERAGQPVVRLVREAGGWRLLEPLEAPADTARVERLLRLLQEPSLARLDPQAVDLATLGLAPPVARVEVGIENQPGPVGIEFGGTQPVTGERYVRVGDTVHLTLDRHYHLLLAEPAAWAASAAPH